MLISYIKRGLSMAASHYVAKPLFIAFLSILVAYYLPDLTAGIIEQGMPDFPGIEQTQKIDFYEYVQLFSMMLILVFSCWTSFYGIYGLIRYTMFQKHQGKKKLILVIVTYMYMIIGFANTYFLVSYVGDGGDALYKFQNYYKLSQNKETKELMIQKELRVSNSNALFGIKDKLWSGVDTKEQLQLWNSDLFNEISEPLPVDFIFKGIEYPEPKIVKYLPDNKISVYTDCLYFSTITIASVGYGDIMPQSGLAKFLVCLETIMGQLLLALGIASAYSGISTTSKNNRMAN